jgi:phosphoribosylformylglycinamidine (FGAM) synthase-like enzyme
MTPYEMMLSESQERMLMVLKPGREGEAEAIFRKWELDFAVIGRVTDTRPYGAQWNGESPPISHWRRWRDRGAVLRPGPGCPRRTGHR